MGNGKTKILLHVSHDSKYVYHNVHIMRGIWFSCCSDVCYLLKQVQIFNAFHTPEILMIYSSIKIPLSRKQHYFHRSFELLVTILNVITP